METPENSILGLYLSYLPIELQDIVYTYVEPEVELAALFPTNDDFYYMIYNTAYAHHGYAVIQMLDYIKECFPVLDKGPYGDSEINTIMRRFTYYWKERVNGYKHYLYEENDDADYDEYINAVYELLHPMLREPTHSHALYNLVKKYRNYYKNAQTIEDE